MVNWPRLAHDLDNAGVRMTPYGRRLAESLDGPILKGPETAAEHLLNALQLLADMPTYYQPGADAVRDITEAVQVRIEKALAQMEAESRQSP